MLCQVLLTAVPDTVTLNLLVINVRSSSYGMQLTGKGACCTYPCPGFEPQQYKPGPQQTVFHLFSIHLPLSHHAPLLTALKRQKQADLWEFEESLVYILSSSIHNEILLKKAKKEERKKEKKEKTRQ